MAWTLVTGGAKSLGAAICRTLALHGHDIVVHYNTSAHEAEAIAEFCRQQNVKAATIQGDFATKESTLHFVKRYQEQFLSTKYLINNVGKYLIAPLSKTDVDPWYALFQTNLHAPFILMQALTASLKENKGGIINIGTAGIDNVTADTYSSAYRCTKLSLWMLTKSLAKELAASHVTVNMVSPGYLETSVDMPKSFPMGRPAALSEVADLVEFLLSPKGEYITGQNIEVAGGIKL